MKQIFRIVSIAAFFLFVIMVDFAFSELTIDNYTQVSSTRVSRVVWEFTYTAEVTNSGEEDVANVTAEVTSNSSYTTVIEGTLEFGDVASGETVASTNTFTFQHNRLYDFDWSDMGWTIDYESAGVYPPTVSIEPGETTIDQGDTVTLTWSTIDADYVHIDNGIGSVSTSGSVTVEPEYTTIYTLTATGAGGSTSIQAEVHVAGGPAEQSQGTFGYMYNYIIPEDAGLDYYEEDRFAIVTGLVYDIDESPIEGVNATILGHPEYGTAITDSDGRYTLPVEGGGYYTVEFKKEGLISAQRQVNVPWNDFAITDTLRMIEEDTANTTITFDGDADSVFTHQSSLISDDDGDRSATLVFLGDNTAYLVDENGADVQELSTITVRATEYTEPEVMPADLPPTSAFTYCTELSVDGAQRVRFENPVVMWVDNFLEFDVGEIVPVGYYDRDRGVWVPSDNGVVVELLDTDEDGLVDALDSDGDGEADDLDGDGDYTDEVQGLEDSSRYISGDSFWRSEIDHFTPWDCNWPYGPPEDAIPPNPDTPPNVDQQKEESADCKGNYNSYVEERSRIFHEDIPIPGTDIKLHYASNRVEGYKTLITVQASGESVPDSLNKIIVKVSVAGRLFKKVLSPLPDQTVEILWDGLDSLGNEVNDTIDVGISIGFAYNLIYYPAREDFYRAFAQTGAAGASYRRGREDVIYWKKIKIQVISRKGYSSVAEGWTISSHHLYQSNDGSLLKGDGDYISSGLTDIECVYKWIYANRLRALAIDASGNVYIGGLGSNYIIKMDRDGNFVESINIGISPTYELAIDQSGNLYVTTNYQVLKVNIDGDTTVIAGTGESGYSNDGVLAVEAEIASISPRIAVDSIGNLYLSDGYRIRKVDTDGVITTIAGTGIAGFSGDGGMAVEANLRLSAAIAVDAEGNVYTADTQNGCIRKIDTSGIITSFAEESVPMQSDLISNSYGELYVSDLTRILKVDSSGNITVIAGTGEQGVSGDGGMALNAQISSIAMALDPKGNIYTLDNTGRWGSSYLRKICKPKLNIDGSATFVDENGMRYLIDRNGYHGSSVDVDTGMVLSEFSYDEDGNLVSITDQFDNVVSIVIADGSPTEIISSDGLKTDLELDEDGRLIQITYPDDSEYRFEYTDDGLLTAKIDPSGNRFANEFDSSGHLISVSDDEGGNWSYSVTAEENDGDILVEKLSAEGDLTTYLDHTDPDGTYTSTITDSAGNETFFTRSSDGLSAEKTMSCGMILSFQYDIDPEYKYEYVNQITKTTPSGLTKATSIEKTYTDTTSDDVPDVIAETITVNESTVTTLTQNIEDSTKIITSPENRVITITYDPETLLTQSLSISGLNDVNYDYDSHGRLTSVTNGTRQAYFGYNSDGFLEWITDPENETTTYARDSVGRVTGVSRPDGSMIDFIYDANGNMTVLTNPNSVDHEFSYNAVNKPSGYETPLSGSYSYVYDKDRRLTQTNFPSGDQILNVYSDGLLTQIQTPEADIDLTYNCSSKIESISSVGEIIEYGYDGKLLNDVMLEGTVGESLSYTYNNDFNVTEFTYAGETESFSYDLDGLLTESSGFTITRNEENGLPESVSDDSATITREFNGYGEVESSTLDISGTDMVAWSLERDGNGRITEKTETAGGTTSTYDYTYDAVGRLLTVTKGGTLVEEYEYDANGVRTYEKNTLRGISSRASTYSDEDHLLTSGSVTYQHDVDGFLTEKTDGSETTYYDYSSRGELLNVTLPDNTLIEYIHDPLGRRIAKVVDGTTTEKYLWQGLSTLLAVYDGSDNLLQRFEYADGRMPLTMTLEAVTYYLGYDQVGSLRVVSDSAGNVIKRIDYDSFGNIITDTNEAFDVPFGFAGGLQDPDTGLVRFGYRDYDPDTGRWTAKDPILFAGGDTDLYGYVQNDPVNFIDPWGLKLTSGQSAAVTVASSAAAFTASLFGSPAAGAVAGAIVGAIGTLVAEASDGDFDLSWKDFLNNTASGAIGGYAGGLLGELGKAAGGLRAGWGMMGALGGVGIDAVLYGSDPLLENPCE